MLKKGKIVKNIKMIKMVKLPNGKMVKILKQ